MAISNKDWIPKLILLLIIIFGGWFRIYGISANHSFWADEALIASYARDIISGDTSITQGVGAIWYQSLHIGLVTISVFLFGINEFAARLPYILISLINIIIGFKLTKKLSNNYGGYLSAYLLAFSQLNLANSTQSKPYIALQLFLLLLIYLMIQSKTKINLIFHHGLIIFLLTITLLFHISGSLFWVIYLIYLFDQIVKNKYIKNKLLIFALLTIILCIYIYLFKIYILIGYFFNFNFHNNIVYIRNIMMKQYGIFVFPAILGLLILKRNYIISIGILIYTFILIFSWTFIQYSHNIRYLVPLFGIIFVFFGVFWGRAGEFISIKYKVKGAKLLPLIIILLFFISGYKIVRSPQVYYSPNTDFYGDVQIANYKEMYRQIRIKIPQYKNNDVVIFNDLIDAHRWYLPEKTITSYFTKGTKQPVKHIIEGGLVYGSLSDFKKQLNKYPKGILIVEDWESLLPEDIKQYAKKNLKREIRVESLEVAKDDPWPLEVYSWGL